MTGSVHHKTFEPILTEVEMIPVEQKRTSLVLKVGLFLGLVGLGMFLYFWFGQYLNLKVLADQETLLRQFQVNHPWLVYGYAFAVYVVATSLSFPGAAVFTLLFGWYFGFLIAICAR